MKRLIITLFALIGLISCNEGYDIEVPDLRVTAVQTVKAGEAVLFTIDGNPDIITFYSGEQGNSYEYKETDRIESSQMHMSFMTTTSSGTPGFANPSSLPICYSTDFSGEYTASAVQAATWTELNDRFKMPQDTEKTSVPSGLANVDDIFPNDGSPVYLMMSYAVEKYDESKADGKGNGRTQWNIQNLILKGVSGNLSSDVYDMIGSGWQFVYGDGMDNNASQFPMLPESSQRLLFRVDFRPATDMQLWAVSGPLVRPGDINMGYDTGVAIKSLSDPALKTYKHVYTQPGEYTATFVGVNTNIYSREETVCKVRIVVEEADKPLDAPEDFDVSAEWLECKAGEYIEYSFTGEAETIEYWSGEKYHDYKYAKTERVDYADMYMEFKSALIAGAQPDNFKIKYSSDFSGTMTEAEILKAEWTDISSRFTLADTIYESGNPNKSVTDFEKYVDSGRQLISDCFSGKPIYLAVFWEIKPYEADKLNTRTATWISGWKISAGTQPVFDMNTATDSEKPLTLVEGASYGEDTSHCNWYKSDFNEYKWHFRFYSHFRPAEGRKAYAVINEPVQRSSTSVGTDTSIPVKTANKFMPASWVYTYGTPGTYEAVFDVTRLVDGETVKENKKFTIIVK